MWWGMKGAMVVFVCVFLLPANVPADEQVEGMYTLNGEELESYAVTPLMELGWNDPRILVDIGRSLTLLLDRPGEYHFVQSTNETDQVYQEVDGDLKLVGITLAGKNEIPKSARIQDLRGVFLSSYPTQSQLDVLAHIDPEMTFVRYVLPHKWKTTSYMPSLNPAIRFLQIEDSGTSPNSVDISSITNLVNLEFLILEKDLGEPVDLALIESCNQLKYLNLTMQNLEHVECLEALKELRALDLSWCRELTNIGFVAECPKLCSLRICMTPVRDLTPISGLKHIEHIDARSSAVTVIPCIGIPSLKTFKLIASGVSDDIVEQFKIANPQCTVLHDWDSSLRAGLKNVNRFRVRSGGAYHIEGDPEPATLYETTDSTTIAELVEMIRIDPDESDFYCGCYGNPTFEFYQGNELAVTLSYHHGRSLRWLGGDWPGDGALSADSQDKLITWLDQHGVSGPREEVEYQIEQDKVSRREWQVWTNAMPASQRSFWSYENRNQVYDRPDVKGMKAALQKEYPETEEQIRVLLEWYAVGDSEYAYSRVIMKLLFEYSTQEIVSVASPENVSIGVLEGATRIFAGWDFSVSRKQDQVLIPVEFQKRMLEHSQQHSDANIQSRAMHAFRSEE